MKLFKRKYIPQTKHKTSLAFTIGGQDYFRFDDIFNLPYTRGLTALLFYDEVRMRCSYEFLKLHVEKVNEILSDPKKINIPELSRLNKQLEQRVKFIIAPDLIWKLASVVFFDKSENPLVYDAKYGQEKIAFWKKYSSMKDFFLSQPMIELIPYLRDCDIDFQTYSLAVEAISQAHLENLTSTSYSKQPITKPVKQSH